MYKKKNSCWICRQKNNIIFKPCLCKGTLSYVHPKCLNRWATNEYNRKQDVQCPNCKYNYIFQIKECKKVNLKQISLIDKPEKVILIMLTLAQIIVSMFDFMSVFDEILTNQIHILHFSTVLILLSAAAYNIVDMIISDIELEILELENENEIQQIQ